MLNQEDQSDLVSAGEPVGQLLQAAHHPLIPEVIGKRFRPFRQQLQNLWSDLSESQLEIQNKWTVSEQQSSQSGLRFSLLDVNVQQTLSA